jgi:hypothetical protein
LPPRSRMVCAADSPERPPPTTMTLEDMGEDRSISCGGMVCACVGFLISVADYAVRSARAGEKPSGGVSLQGGYTKKRRDEETCRWEDGEMRLGVEQTQVCANSDSGRAERIKGG